VNGIRALLPPAREAAALRSVYYERVHWLFTALPADEFDARIFGPIYNGGTGSDAFDATAPGAPVQLATLFALLANAAAADPRMTDRTEARAHAERYFRLACAALLCGRVIERPTIEALEALGLVNVYLCFTDLNPKVRNLGWVMNAIVVKVAQAVSGFLRGIC
jgi:hypothetical protein